MHIHPKTSSLLIGAALLAALSGCGKKNENSATPAAAAAPAPAQPSPAGSNQPKAAPQAANNTLPKGDPSTPLSGYRKVESGNQVMFQYYALSNMPVAYEDIAQSYSMEYRRTTDGFKRKDIVKALQPRIDQEIGNAKSARYVMLEQQGNTLLDRYDFDKKTFAVKEMNNDRYTYFNDNSDYTLSTTNASDFSALKVPDEAKARAIEGYLSKYAQMRMEIYAYAQDADPSNRRVKLQVMKVRLFSPTNELLAEI